jgi:glycosyltransferase involved in cell wall biosynthesis
MRIAVVASMEAGVEKAYAINSVNMAQGFAKLGHDVTLITFRHRTDKRELDELKEQYDIRESLRWIQVPRVFRKEFISPDLPFASMALFHLWRLRPEFVFSRSYIAPLLSARYGFPTVAESHAHTDNRTPPFLRMIDGSTRYEQFRYLITISDVLSEHYQTLGVPRNKMLVLPTGVDMDRFTRPEQLPPSPYLSDKPNVAYVGHLYDYKGIPTILETAKLRQDVQFHLIGGMPQDIERTQTTITEQNLMNVTLHGHQSQSDIPPYLWNVDILLLPPTLDHPSARWTSPVKLGEYLASETPVIATRIPALQDWITDEQVTFIEPDSASAMSQAIKSVLSNPQEAQQKSERGIELAHQFSYRTRAQTILEKCGF